MKFLPVVLPPFYVFVPVLLFWLTACQQAPRAGKDAAAPPAAETTARAPRLRERPSPLPAIPVLEAPARLPAGAVLSVRLSHSVDTSSARAGDRFSASLATPVRAGEDLVLPEGTEVNGRVVAAKPSGRLRGRGYLTLALDEIEVDGRNFPLTTSRRSWSTGNHKKRNLTLIGGGSGVGALIGGIASGGTGALIGAGAGAAAGTAGAVITGRKQVHLPAETHVQFKLTRAVTIRE